MAFPSLGFFIWAPARLAQPYLLVRECFRSFSTHTFPVEGSTLIQPSLYATAYAAPPTRSVAVDNMTYVGPDASLMASPKTSRFEYAVDECRRAANTTDAPDELMDMRELAADVSSASGEVVDYCCPPPAVAPSPICYAIGACQLPVDAPLARGEVKDSCQLPADASPSRYDSTSKYAYLSMTLLGSYALNAKLAVWAYVVLPQNMENSIILRRGD